MYLLSLPFELIILIFQSLTICDLYHCWLTCTYFQKVISSRHWDRTGIINIRTYHPKFLAWVSQVVQRVRIRLSQIYGEEGLSYLSKIKEVVLVSNNQRQEINLIPLSGCQKITASNLTIVHAPIVNSWKEINLINCYFTYELSEAIKHCYLIDLWHMDRISNLLSKVNDCQDLRIRYCKIDEEFLIAFFQRNKTLRNIRIHTMNVSNNILFHLPKKCHCIIWMSH